MTADPLRPPSVGAAPAGSVAADETARVRARELGLFLRSRRARIAPATVGFPVTARRRSPGLRREEVAVLAGVSPTWYAYLEQGRRIRPSAAVLESLVRVLALTEDERRYVYLMAFGHPPGLRADEVRPHGRDLGELMTSIGAGPDPVFVADQHTNLLAWNDATVGWFGDFGQLHPARRYLLWWLCTTDDARQRIVHWERETREAIARFRSAYAARPHDPVFGPRIAELSAASPDFRRWWADHEVRETGTGIKELYRPDLGLRRFRVVILKIVGSDFHGVVVHLPVP